MTVQMQPPRRWWDDSARGDLRGAEAEVDLDVRAVNKQCAEVLAKASRFFQVRYPLLYLNFGWSSAGPPKNQMSTVTYSRLHAALKCMDSSPCTKQ
eukprot:SAG31_NODE_2573_length_5458_cov_1.552528_1_plen_96_part_00